MKTVRHIVYRYIYIDIQYVPYVTYSYFRSAPDSYGCKLTSQINNVVYRRGLLVTETEMRNPMEYGQLSNA